MLQRISKKYAAITAGVAASLACALILFAAYHPFRRYSAEMKLTEMEIREVSSQCPAGVDKERWDGVSTALVTALWNACPYYSVSPAALRNLRDDISEIRHMDGDLTGDEFVAIWERIGRCSTTA